LELIDSDGDGRVRAKELIDAVKWAAARLENPDDLVKPQEALPLEAIDVSSEEGAAMLAAARHVLELIGKPDATSISVADTDDARAHFAQMPFNGDGIVTSASAADDEAVVALIDDVIACVGGEIEASGNAGVSAAKLDELIDEVRAQVALHARADEDPAIRVLGDATGAAAEALQAVADKISDYFTRCRLAEFDPRAAAAMNGTMTVYETLASTPFVQTAAEVAELPLAQVEPGKPLDLTTGINPAWEERIARFRDEVVVPLGGDGKTLAQEEFRAIQAKLAPYAEWSAALAASKCAALPPERLEEIARGDTEQRLRALIE